MMKKAAAFNNFFLSNASLNSNNAALPRSVPSRTEKFTNIVTAEQNFLDILSNQLILTKLRGQAELLQLCHEKQDRRLTSPSQN